MKWKNHLLVALATVLGGSLALSQTFMGNMFKLGGSTTANLPASSAYTVGALIYDLDAGAPKYNDGAQWKAIGSGGSGGASSLQGAYEGGNTIAMVDGGVSIYGDGGVSLQPQGVRSDFTVYNERLDLKSLGVRDAGLQVLIEALNGGGTSQVIAQAGDYAMLQAGTSPAFPYYFYASAAGKFVAMEADDVAGAIYVGGSAVNSPVNIGSAGNRYITIGNAVGATTLDLKAGTGGFSLQTQPGGPVAINAGGGPSNLTVNGSNLTLATTTSGDLTLSAASTMYVGTDSLSSSIRMGSGRTPVLFGDARSGGVDGGSAGTVFSGPGDGGIAAGNVVFFDAAGKLAKSASTTSDGGLREVAGVAIDGDVTAAQVATVYGTVARVLMDSAPGAGDVGKALYVSESTPGVASLMPPAAGGTRVYKVGLLLGTTADGASRYPILLQPQLIKDN